MARFTKEHFFISFFKVLLLILPSLCWVQEIQRYSGPYKVGNYSGEAEFEYRLTDNDTVLDGAFEMQRSNLEDLFEKGDYSFLFTGAFKDNYANGPWRFQFGEFRPDTQTQVLDYQYRLNVSGTQQEASGVLIKGKPDGDWSFVVNKIKDSEVAKTLFKSTITFDNGVPQKSFQIQHGNNTLVGRFLRNGLAHDEWTLYSDTEVNGIESWHFDDGILRKIQIQEDGPSKTVAIFNGNPEVFKTINLDSRYISIIKLRASVASDKDTLGGKMDNILKENAAYYKKIDDILSELGESTFLPEFKVKAPYHPLDTLESAQFETAKKYIEDSNSISESLLGDSQLNILRRSDTNAQYLYNVVQTITTSFVNPLMNVVKYHDEQILEHVSREDLIKHLWPNGRPSTALTIESKDGSKKTVFTDPDANRFDFSGNSIKALSQMAEYTLMSLDSVQKVLDTKLAKNRREQKLIDLEEAMLAKTGQLNKMIDTLSPSLPRASFEAINNISKTSEEKLSDYSQTSDENEKLKKGTHYVTCLDSMIQLAKVVSKQPARTEEIREKYQDAIWNPFMATIMNEEIKKRIVTAYRKVLIPHLMERTKNDLNCDNVSELTQLFNGAYKRMLELRDEETRKLERKLKREQDPMVVIELFNLQTAADNN